ncbi:MULTISPECIES: pheST operon leader peptide PheM [Duffyella]|nr:pheST operon leader peptide PheM [Duffyella gerundensis]QTO56006.1 pheST operon leader peptide PheM [Duffyella gerundensis]
MHAAVFRFFFYFST